MVSTFADLSKWLAIPALQPENVTGLLVLLGQGNFVAEDILPIVASTDSFQWQSETANDKFKVAKKATERGLPTVNDFVYVKLSDECYNYREMASITSKAVRRGNVYSFINLIAKKTEMLGQKHRMNAEKDALTAMQNTTKYTTINTYSASTALTTIATSDPYKDTEKCKVEVENVGYADPDILIMGARDKSQLKLSDKVRTTTQYTENYLPNGMLVERFNGLEVLTSNARYISGSTSINILSGQAIVTVRGAAGEIRESEQYGFDTDYSKKTQVLDLLTSRSFVPIITHPKYICIWKNVS